MIETARYLTNDTIITDLKAKNYDNVDEIEEDQQEVKEWLLTRLNAIARGDFVEYNAKPYTRYSLNAIANLYDFAPVAYFTLDRAVFTLRQCI